MNAAVTCPRCHRGVEEVDAFCVSCGQALNDRRTATLSSSSPTDQQEPIGLDAVAELLADLRAATAGDFDVYGELGRGGMAAVYLAHDIALDRKVAIKVLLPPLVLQPGMAERFKHEARTTARLSHSNIIPIHSVRESGRIVFFVMKFVEGKALDQILRRFAGPLPVALVQSILTQVGSALTHAHSMGVFHRDVKPSNILIDFEGAATVTDFGIAKRTDIPGLTVTGATLGTPAYMSPEQCHAQPVTPASDQYSLGIMAFEMISGSIPFRHESPMELMRKHCYEPVPPLAQLRPDCPALVCAAVERMLTKDPGGRWPTIEAAVDALGRTRLGPDNPYSKQLAHYAREDTEAFLARVQTPHSPLPATKAPTPRAAPNANQDRGAGHQLSTDWNSEPAAVDRSTASGHGRVTRLQSPGRAVVKGNVVGGRMRRALPHAKVGLAPGNLNTLTDSQGRFAVTGVGEGKYWIKTEAPSHDPLTRELIIDARRALYDIGEVRLRRSSRPSAFPWQRPTLVLLITGAAIATYVFGSRNQSPTVVPTSATASIAGSVTTAGTGSPVQGATVYARAIEGSDPLALLAVTDSSGHFEFDSVIPGRYRLLARAQGFGPDSSEVVDLEGGVVFTPNLELAVITTVPQPVRYALRGMVRSTTGQAVSGTLVELGTLRAMADEVGRFQFSDLAQGDYELRASATGFEPHLQNVRIPPDGELQITLSWETTDIAGMLVDSLTGVPVRGATVEAADVTTVVGTDGRFTAALPATVLSLTAKHPSYSQMVVDRDQATERILMSPAGHGILQLCLQQNAGRVTVDRGTAQEQGRGCQRYNLTSGYHRLAVALYGRSEVIDSIVHIPPDSTVRMAI